METKKFTDGRTDGRTDAGGYNIIRPFFKRAYKNLSKMVLKKKVSNFFYYFYGLNLGPPGAGPS